MFIKQNPACTTGAFINFSSAYKVVGFPKILATIVFINSAVGLKAFRVCKTCNVCFKISHITSNLSRTALTALFNF